MKTKIGKLATYNYANDNKLFGCKWSPTTFKNICLFENLAKKNQLNKKAKSKNH